MGSSGGYPTTGARPAMGPSAAMEGGFYLGGGRGWVGAYPGHAVYTADGAATWQQGDGWPAPTAAVTVVPGGRNAWALQSNISIAPHLAIWRSADGGETWRRLPDPPAEFADLTAAPDTSVWGIEAPPVSRSYPPAPAWMCPATSAGCGTAAWVSRDGGRTWTAHGTGGLSLTAVAPLDARRAFAVAVTPGDQDAVVSTADGGVTWQVIAVMRGALAPDRAVGFWSARGGWGLGTSADPTAVLQTDDGGHNWTLAGRAPAATTALIFNNPLHGWAWTEVGGLTGGLEVTDDGGRTWHTAPSQPSGLAPAGPLALVPSGAAGLVGAFWGDDAVDLAGTADGGRHWWKHTVRQASAFTFSPPNRTWRVQPGGALAVSSDRGETWTSIVALPFQRSDQGPYLTASSAGEVWATGWNRAGPVLVHGVDARTWKAYALSPAIATTYSVPAVTAGGPAQAWILGSGGLWETTDGGARWVRLAA